MSTDDTLGLRITQLALTLALRVDDDLISTLGRGLTGLASTLEGVATLYVADTHDTVSITVLESIPVNQRAPLPDEWLTMLYGQSLIVEAETNTILLGLGKFREQVWAICIQPNDSVFQDTTLTTGLEAWRTTATHLIKRTVNRQIQSAPQDVWLNLWDVSPQSLYIVDLKGVIQYVNNSACALHGLPVNALREHTLSSFAMMDWAVIEQGKNTTGTLMGARLTTATVRPTRVMYQGQPAIALQVTPVETDNTTQQITQRFRQILRMVTELNSIGTPQDIITHTGILLKRLFDATEVLLFPYPLPPDIAQQIGWDSDPNSPHPVAHALKSQQRLVIDNTQTTPFTLARQIKTDWQSLVIMPLLAHNVPQAIAIIGNSLPRGLSTATLAVLDMISEVARVALENAYTTRAATEKGNVLSATVIWQSRTAQMASARSRDALHVVGGFLREWVTHANDPELLAQLEQRLTEAEQRLALWIYTDVSPLPKMGGVNLSDLVNEVITTLQHRGKIMSTVFPNITVWGDKELLLSALTGLLHLAIPQQSNEEALNLSMFYDTGGIVLEIYPVVTLQTLSSEEQQTPPIITSAPSLNAPIAEWWGWLRYVTDLHGGRIELNEDGDPKVFWYLPIVTSVDMHRLGTGATTLALPH